MSPKRTKAVASDDVQPLAWSEESPATTCARDFRMIGDGDGYRLKLLGVPIEFELDRPRRDHHELTGQLTVRTGLSGARTFNGILSTGTFNTSSPTARQTRAKQLADLSRAPQIDWHRLLEEFSILVLDAERAGGPAIDLRTVSPAIAADGLDVHGIKILDRHPMIAFGDGGSAKSLLALSIAGELSNGGLRVGYADWELSPEEHRTRLEQLFGPVMPEIFYIRCARPMTAEADRIKRLVREHALSYLVCDSISFACDGPPEAAEVAARYFQCLRQIGVGSLSLAHTNKSDDADRKPFGSAFWHNGARATWNVKLSETSEDGRTITIGCYNRKSNLAALQRAVGFRVSFDEDRIQFNPVDLATVDDLAKGLPLWQRMKEAISHQPHTLASLAEEFGTTVETLDRNVRRKKHLFTRVNGADGIARIALVSRRP